MRARDAVTPVALVLLAASSAGYAYFVDRRAVSDADRHERARDVFPSFRVGDVRRVELHHGAEAMVLERAPSEAGTEIWMMTAPRRERVEPAEVDVLLRELALAVRLRVVTDSSATGLQTPRVRGAITTDSLEYRFALGADAPMPEGAAYLRVDGEGIFVVGRSLKVQLLRGEDVYRDHLLVPMTAGEVKRLEVQGGAAGGFALERHGQTFRIGGKGLRASRSVVDRLFAAIADVRADSFLTDEEADRNMGSGPLAVSLTPRDEGRPAIALRVGGACPGRPETAGTSPAGVVVVRLTGGRDPSGASRRVSACAPGRIREALDTSPRALVDDSPLFSQADEVEQLLLAPADGGRPRVDIARKGHGWHERAPEDRDLASEESDAATALVVALTHARALEVRLPSPEETVVVSARVSVERASEAPEVIELGVAGEDGTTLARRVDDGAILRLGRSVARRFQPQPNALRAPHVWSTPIEAGSVVAVNDTCGGTRQRLERSERADAPWTMRVPSGLGVDAAATAELTRGLIEAKAEAWEAERDDGTFGFGSPGSCAVTLVLAGTSADASRRSASLVFGGPRDGGGDGVYARTVDDPAVFVVPLALRELVSRCVIDRRPMTLDMDAVDRVTLKAAHARVVLKREGGRLVRSATLQDAGDAGRLEEALAGLQARTALHPGPARRDEGMDTPTLEIEATTLSDATSVNVTRITIGALSNANATDVYLARVAGVDATYAVPQQVVRGILDAL
ncbi:MAG: DUF4340 domain-containing protein [Myxococcota bacterium]|nr:DUF4340 domain-containing protein [Myxococcota bacterium]